MTTPFIRKTLVLMDKVLKWPIRPRHLLAWNAQTQTLSFNNSFRQTKAWYVAVLVASIEIVLYFGAVHGIIAGFLTKPDVHKHNVDVFCVSVYSHLFWGMWLAIEWVFFSFGKEMVGYVNSLFHFQTSPGREADRIQVRLGLPNQDLVGMLGLSFVSFSAITSPFVAFALASKLIKVLIISVSFDYIQLETLPGNLAPLVTTVFFFLHLLIIFPVTLELFGAQMVYGVGVLFIPYVQVHHLTRLIYLGAQANTCMLALREYQ